LNLGSQAERKAGRFWFLVAGFTLGMVGIKKKRWALFYIFWGKSVGCLDGIERIAEEFENGSGIWWEW